MHSVVMVYYLSYHSFSLVILFSLGIDYAIFLLNRFNEEVQNDDIHTALITAMKKMGTVIITACIIIIGTVAALYTSGALTLMQIATVLIIDCSSITYSSYLYSFRLWWLHLVKEIGGHLR